MRFFQKSLLVSALLAPMFLTGCIPDSSVKNAGQSDRGRVQGQLGFGAESQGNVPGSPKNNPSSLIIPQKQHKWQSLNYFLSYVAEKDQITEKASYIKDNCVPESCYIESSNIDNSDLITSARFVIKILPENVIKFRDGLGKSVELNNEEIRVQDYSGEVVDIESRKSLLKEQIAQLTILRDKTEDVKSLIEIADRIAQAQNDIESLDGKFRVIENNTAFDTLNISYNSKIEPPNIFTPLTESVAAVPGLVIQGLAALVYLVTALVPISIIGIPIALYFRRRKKKAV